MTRPATAGTAGTPGRDESRPLRVNLGKRELLGKGSFGMVYRAMDLDTNRIIAVKEVVIAPGQLRPEQLSDIRNEITVMQKLTHPNIVKCLGEHWDGVQYLRIYMDYVAGGTISSVLRSFGKFQENQVSRFAAQILSGLSYLHERKIAHRDLKGDNLLVETDGTLKLADFGTARELATLSKSVAGTAFFMAPEVVKAVGHSFPADIWSAGCCVIEMLTGKPPFSGMSNQYAIMMHVAELTDDKVPIPTNVSPAARAFIARCLTVDAAKRATADELLQDPWITSPPDIPDTTKSVNVLTTSAESGLPSMVQPDNGDTIVAHHDSFADNPVQSFSEDN
jgi:serine/threonine protein kinase